MFILKNHLSGMRSGFCYTIDAGTSLELLWVILLLPVLWKFYGFGSAEPVPSCAPADPQMGCMLGLTNI